MKNRLRDDVGGRVEEQIRTDDDDRPADRTTLALIGMPKRTANWDEVNGNRLMVFAAFI
jgi:hypothetical protein